MIGQTVAHYKIIEKLGAGGMGEVYRAEDTNLHRHVAIKVLPDEFAHDAERLSRFQREAQVLAFLNHPNIATLYGLEESGGKRFIVMELVEGQTLAHRLLKGPLPVEEALEVCRQIAEGLEAAHEKGVVHRDLKPGNVMITADDKVKILDFGLAKALAGDSRLPDTTHSPTITEAMTRPGVILGTAAYMSPEQARGKPVDKRADIWSFGCILFECLAGKRAFEGANITETLASILKEEPDWQALPPATPSKLWDLLRRCLQKDPRERLHDIADARIEMREPMILPKAPLRESQRLPLGWLITACVTALVIGILIGPTVMRYFKPGNSQILQPVVRSPIKLEPGHWLEGMRALPPLGVDQPTRIAMAISRDGRFIVYSAIAEIPGPQVKSQLYLRRTDQLEARPISGTEGGISPFLSPDSRSVGFWADGKLMKVPIDGGVPVTLCGCEAPFGASWGTDNSIVFASDGGVGLSRVSADGGRPEILTAPDKAREESSHRLPHWLPDSKGVLFTIMREPFDPKPHIALLDLKTRQWREALEDAVDARYVPTGHLVFLRQGTLLAVPFDLQRLELTGQPVPVVAKVVQAANIHNRSFNTGAGQFSISDSGWLVYAAGAVLPDLKNSLVWVDQKGKAQPISPLRDSFFVPRLSPDGQRIACQTIGEKEDLVWIYDLNRGTASRVTGEGRAAFVNWTPDSTRVVFGWHKSGSSANLYWQLADGSQAMERLTTSDNYQAAGPCSPDGTKLAFVESRPDTNTDILLLDLRSRRVRPFLNSPAWEAYPEFSPDGGWLAYTSNESGRDEVYVRPFPGPGGKWLISQGGGLEPLWGRNGKQLFYRGWENDQVWVWVVDVRTEGGFSPGKPRLLFKEAGMGGTDPIRGWDISLDGQKFLMVKLEERKSQPVTEMILVQNWSEELKRLCPTGK
jgi:serine/threonine-protein kinase